MFIENSPPPKSRIITDKTRFPPFFSIFFALFSDFPILGDLCWRDGLLATKSRLFGKIIGGTPNPQVKKVGVIPNSDPPFFDLWVRVTPLFLPKMSSYRRKPREQNQKMANPRKVQNNREKKKA